MVLTLLTLLSLQQFLLLLLILEVDPVGRLATGFLLLVYVVDEHLQRKDAVVAVRVPASIASMSLFRLAEAFDLSHRG